jgi:hypothetical protein
LLSAVKVEVEERAEDYARQRQQEESEEHVLESRSAPVHGVAVVSSVDFFRSKKKWVRCISTVRSIKQMISKRITTIWKTVRCLNTWTMDAKMTDFLQNFLWHILTPFLFSSVLFTVGLKAGKRSCCSPVHSVSLQEFLMYEIVNWNFF